MNTISITLQADDDGTLHLPLPPEMQHGTFRVTVTLEPLANEAAEFEASRRNNLVQSTAAIRASNLFAAVADPVTWQREIRADRLLPGQP